MLRLRLPLRACAVRRALLTGMLVSLPAASTPGQSARVAAGRAGGAFGDGAPCAYDITTPNGSITATSGVCYDRSGMSSWYRVQHAGAATVGGALRSYSKAYGYQEADASPYSQVLGGAIAESWDQVRLGYVGLAGTPETIRFRFFLDGETRDAFSLNAIAFGRLSYAVNAMGALPAGPSSWSGQIEQWANGLNAAVVEVPWREWWNAGAPQLNA